jgi:hypothetical protein
MRTRAAEVHSCKILQEIYVTNMAVPESLGFNID